MATFQRFTTTARGFIQITGNTLGLAGSNTALVGGIRNFTTSTPNPPSGGTTTSIASNGSSAFLTLPTNYEILYAELFWGGIYQDNTTGLNVSAQINNNINFTDPRGITTSVPVTPSTSQQNIGLGYVRTSDVTSIVKAAGAGKYTVSAVPAILTGTFTTGNIDNYFAGWSLYVVVQDPTQSYKNMTIWASWDPVGTFVNVSGFSTPSTGAVTGRLFISAGSGNSNLTGDQLRFGPTSATVVALSTPSNPINNFFPGIICNRLGTVATTGTWGNVNNTAGVTPAQGNRSMYDLTGVDVSSTLQNNQTSAVININSSGDGIISNALALEVDVNSASLTPITKTVDKQNADVGETLTYTISFGNSGLVTALNTILVDTIPTETQFVNNSVAINFVNQPGTSPLQPGLSLGNIGAGQRVTVTFSVLITTTPQNFPLATTLPNFASIGYSFVSAPGLATIPANDESNTVITTIYRANLSSSKIVNKTFANVGDILTYTIPITNLGDATATNIIFIDTIPNDTTLVTNSFRQDGVNISGTPNTPGITLPNNIGVSRTSTITFQVRVTTIPSPNPISNTASIKYSYTIDSTTTPNRIGNNSSNTNTVNTQVNNANLGNITKLTDKSYATCGEQITYTIVIPNTGNVTAQNIIFKDTIPSGTTFVNDSVYINGSQNIGSNPNTGFSVPNIAPGSTITITFSVKVQC